MTQAPAPSPSPQIVARDLVKTYRMGDSVIGALQGIAMPSINAMMSKSLGPERQGELQGGMASLMGLASIIGPLALTQTLAYFSAPNANPYFPGAAFVLSAMFALTSLSLLLARLRRANAS